jgi:O-antigen/teichoic acid export membrane protein
MMGQLFWLLSARLASPLASFLIIMMIARIWGKADLGQYTTVLVWLAIFQFLALFGMGEYVSKEVGAHRTHTGKYLTHSLFLVLLSSLLCAGLMVAGTALFEYPVEVRRGIICAVAALPFSSCSLMCQAFFTACQKIRLIVVASAVESVLFVLLGATVIIMDYGLLALVASLVLTRLLSSALNLFLTARHISPLSFRIERQFLWSLLLPASVYGATNAFYQIFIRIDVIMLSKLKDMSTVGLYSSASKLLEIALLIPLTFYLLNLPVAANAYRDSRESMFEKIEARIEEFFVVIFFVFGFGFFFAEHILSLVFGMTFAEAAGILKILMVAFLIWSGEIVLGMSCQAAGYHKANLFIVAARAVLNVALNAILIPLWGAAGAALATLCSIAVSFAGFQYVVKKTVGGLRWLRMIRKPATVCLATMLLLFSLADRVNTFVLASLFLLGYPLMLLALNGFSLSRMRSS